MKMHTTLFWGVALIIVGLLLVIKVILPFHFPIFKILIGLLIVYVGVRIIVGGSWGIHRFRSEGKNGKTVFADAKVNFSAAENKNSVIFGNAVYDFTGATLDDTAATVKVDVVFGRAEVLLPKDVPVRIKYDVAFGRIALPNENAISFGSGAYTNEHFVRSAPHLQLCIDVAFGEAVVKENGAKSGDE